MTRIVGATLAFLAAAMAVRADDRGAPPARKLEALLKEYEAAYQAYRKATNDGDVLKTSREQLDRVRKSGNQQVEKCAAGCLELAQKHPRDPAALDALTWVVRNSTVSARALPENAHLSRAHDRAVSLLRRDHLGSEKLGPVCRSRMALIQYPEGVKLVEEVLAKSPHRSVRAQALAALADHKLFYASFARNLKKEPEQAKRWERVWGKEVVGSVLAADPDRLRQEGERLHERLAKEYADIPDPEAGTLGRLAALKLAALRQPPTVGRPAPEVEGVDIDGKKLKLSDYRGKAVLFVVTGDWCAACDALHPQQQSLARKLAGRAVALVDVNCDASLERRRKINARENITWRAFQEGASDGPIATRWGIEQWPTLFLIDHKGVLRQKYVGSPGEAVLARELEALIKEAEADGKK